MKKESILFGIIGLLAGIIIAGFGAGYSVNHGYGNMMRFMGIDGNRADSISASMHSSNDSSMSMDDMVSNLNGKTGDDFDKLFISEMIDHHQGAIDMANLAKQNAKHDEVKKLADDIVAAQTKEIEQMKAWQKQWGYSTSSTDDSNSMMDMQH